MVEGVEVECRSRAFLPDDRVEALVRPDGRAVPRNVRYAHQQRLQCAFLIAELGLKLARSRSGFLRLAAKLGAFLWGRALEAGADGVALGKKRFDLGLEAAHFAVQRQQLLDAQLDAFRLDRLLDGR